MLKTELRELDKEQIIDLVDAYDTYITNFCDDNAGNKLVDDVCPVCLLEFYDNEYQIILENRFD